MEKVMEKRLTFFNTMGRKKEVFKPLKPGLVGFYSCGPTVYNYAHIGNLRTYIFNDTLKRVLKYAGFGVNHVMNITDVGHLTSDADTGDDKMEKGALREGKSVWQIAEYYTQAFERDLALLNIIPPDKWCKATDHIKEQIEQIQEIENAGYAYVIEDGVYFDTVKLPDYGKLAGLKLDSLEAGARVEVAAGKRNPTDFALWKITAPGVKRQMEWDSPWGRGFPGWHIECSAMACKYLGSEFDIHTGGIDHIPVHHTNEIAQAQACGLAFARYWLHGEFLVIKESKTEDGEKMAKSGEFLTLAKVIERGYDPLAYRYFCLTAHYRKQLSFSWEALDGAASAYNSLKNKILAAKELNESKGLDSSADNSSDKEGAVKEEYESKFLDAITEDLNMPQALAVLWDMIGDQRLSGATRVNLAVKFDAVLGLNLNKVGSETIPVEITKLVEERELHRKNKDWKRSDEVRATITALGYEVRDTPQGPVVRPL